MNYFTLKFHDSEFEDKYLNEQFEIEKPMLKGVVIVLIISAITSILYNLMNGIYGEAYIILASIGFFVILYMFCRNNINQMNYLVLFLQLAMHTLQPIVIYQQWIAGIPPKQYDIYLDYARALMASYYSYSYQIGSSYYLKAIPFIYSLVIQYFIIGYVQEMPIVAPYKLYLTLSIVMTIIRIYYQELGRRRNFIRVHQENRCNLNVLSNFRSAYFSCYLDDFSLKLIKANNKAQKKFNIINQQQFLNFLRVTSLTITNVKMHLEQFIYLLIQKPNEANALVPKHEVMTIEGVFSKQKFKYNITTYVDEGKKLVIVVNIQKMRELVPIPLQQVQDIIVSNLQKTIETNLSPLLQQVQLSTFNSLCLHKLYLDLNNQLLLCNKIIVEGLDQINLNNLLRTTFSKYIGILKDQGISVKVNLPIQYSIMNSKRKHLELLISNLISYCVQYNMRLGLIHVSIQSKETNILDFEFTYSTEQQELKNHIELQLAGFVVNQLGPAPHLVYYKLGEHFHTIRYQLYQNHITEQLAIMRKVGQSNFVVIP